MVRERDPPYLSGARLEETSKGPQFGTASPLRNPLRQDRPSSMFNVPKPGHSRPEHHRQHQPATSSAQNANPPYRQPTFASRQSASPDFVEIPRPTNFVYPTVAAAPKPLFSTGGNCQPVNAYRPPSNVVDLTKRDDDGFNPDKALGIDRYGGFDPTNFVDSAQANENIKALLEGAFDDEDDKPRTRRRKRQADVAAALTEKLDSLKVAGTDAKADAPHDADEEDDGTVEGLNIKLLPHQIDGLAWMLDKEIGTRKKNGVLPKGGILADDMGLGKTIQALSLILTNRRPSADDLAENPKLKVPEAAGKGTLIVAPLALIKQWEGEIKNKVDVFPKLKVLVHHGPSRTKRFEDLKKYDIVITTYQTLTSEHGDSSSDEKGLKVGVFGVHWYRIILDEAHSIKNRNAKMTKAACQLQSVYRWCLTGTPMQNNLDELQSLIHFLKIKPYSDLASWREQIGQPMKNGRGGLAMKRLQYFLKAFMKRRTKDILKKEGGLNFGRGGTHGDGKNEGFKIVARNVQTVVAQFEPAEREFYHKLEARTEKNLDAMMGGDKTDYIGALVLLLRLRQTCNHPALIKNNWRKDEEASSSSRQPAASATPGKPKSPGAEELEDIADMFGALTVETRTCDGCGSKMSQADVGRGAIKCGECKEDLEKLRRGSHSKTSRSKKQSAPKCSLKSQRRNRRVIESDEEEDADDDNGDEESGDWLVPEEERQAITLGKAGGIDDENIEGGGDWLGTEDSDTDEESGISRDTQDTQNTEVEDESADESADSIDLKTMPSTKIRKLIAILEEESDEHKFIVFSEFTSMLDIVEPFLRDAGFRFTRYDGSMKNDDREASLERLRNDDKTRILLCSLRCGSLGLNLTAASRVVILEPFWNPFVEEQAIDRVHRLNQTRDVTVYRLTVANTVEERIIALQEKKRELAKVAIEGGKAVGKLSMNDILRLFRRDAEHDERHEDVMDSGKAAGLKDIQPLGKRTAPPSIPSSAMNSMSGTTTLSQAPRPTKPSQTGVKDASPKFKIPKSMQPEFDAYRQSQVWSERR